ncbi:MAG TPA: hypothetical protein VFJ77_02545 [Gaiellaceae bacterium]|nr:hypothetical protein [Gaiellaceae bacterium]
MRALPLPPRPAAATLAGLLAVLVDVLYVAIVAAQGDAGGREALVAASLALAAAAAFASPATSELPRGLLLGWAAGTLWLWTLLGLASIGLLIAPAAVLALYALVRSSAGLLAPLGGAAAAVLAVTFGLAWTA